jgi:hypothetical protein
MHIKLPPPGFPIQQPETPPSKGRLVREIETAISQDLEDLEQTPPAADQADIRPLDVPGGLQILIAETRAAFQEIADFAAAPGPQAFGTAVDPAPANSLQAARQIVELVLQSLPESIQDPAVWTMALLRAETALETGLQQSVGTVANWREVPDVVVDSVAQSSALVLQALSEEMPNPLLLRPEWVGLAPRLQRFSRRRRAARRRLTDPDHWQGSLDDEEQQR